MKITRLTEYRETKDETITLNSYKGKVPKNNKYDTLVNGSLINY